MMRPSPRSLATVPAALCLSLLAGCVAQDTNPVQPTAVFGKGGGGPSPSVDAANPPWGEQETVDLAVEIAGSGFDAGSTVDFELDGVASTKVRATSVVYNPGTGNLETLVTIEADAELEAFDVAVLNSRGKRGVGADLFTVFEKGGGPKEDYTLTVTLDDSFWGFRSDGDPVYSNGGDVAADISDNRFTFGTRAGKRSDPDRWVKLTIRDGEGATVFNDERLELAGAATRRTLDLFSLDVGADTTVAAYIKWFQDGNQHYLYFGRDCDEPVEIPDEMARVTRLAEDRWMLESVPENPARFCTRPVKGKTVPWVTVDSVYADFKLTFARQ